MIFICNIFSVSEKNNLLINDGENSNYRFSQLKAKDFQSCRLALEKNRLKYFLDRMEEGHRAFGWILNGEVVSYVWVSGGDAVTMCPFEGGVKILIKEKYIYIWDCRTHVDHTGRHLFRDALIHVTRNALDSGIRPFIAIRGSNKPSERAILNAGFSEILQIKFYVFLMRFLLIRIKKRSVFLFKNGILDLGYF